MGSALERATPGGAHRKELRISEALPGRLVEGTRARLQEALHMPVSLRPWREEAADDGFLVIAPHEMTPDDRRRALAAANWSWVHLTSSGADFLTLSNWPRGTLLTRSWRCYGAPLAEYVLHAVLTHEWRRGSPWQEPDSRPVGGRSAPVPAGLSAGGGAGLRGAEVGIAGWGAAGRTAGSVLSALGARVTALSRTSGRRGDGGIAHTTSLERILDVDHLIVALPLTPATEGLFSREVLSRTRHGVHLVNISRARIVDQEALAERCAAGGMFATLDVTEPEPLPPDHPLRAVPGVRISPHVAWRSRDSDGAFADDFARVWQALASGGEAPGVVAATRSERARRAVAAVLRGRSAPGRPRPPSPAEPAPSRTAYGPPGAHAMHPSPPAGGPRGSTRSGKEYLAGLADGRRVYIGGQPLTDIAGNAATAGTARFLADLLDAHHDGSDLVDKDGYPLAYALAGSEEEVRARGAAFASIARRSGGLMGRSPDFLATVVTAWRGAAGHFAERAGHVRRYWESARARNAVLTHAISDPPASRHLGRSASEQTRALHAVGSTAEGLVVRGAKMLATLAPFADDLVVYPFRPLTEEESDQALCFAIPVNTPGLTLYSRPSYAAEPAADTPLAARFDELDAICAFDDVLVPWDRVFIHGDVAMANGLRAGTGMTAYAWHQSAVRAWVKAEFLFDLANACAEASGRAAQQTVRQHLGELGGIAETLRGLVAAGEAGARRDEHGHVVCDVVPLAASGMLQAALYPRAVELLQIIGGSGLVMHPAAADEDPRAAGQAFLGAYFAGAGAGAVAHGRLLRAVSDLAMTRFGSRQVQYERLFLGPPDAFRVKFYEQFTAAREPSALVAELLRDMTHAPAPDRRPIG